MGRSTTVRLDLCVLADIRKGDVAAPAHAAALEALAAAGYRVGVLPVVSSAIAADPYQIDPDYARLFRDDRLKPLAPGVSVDCGLALALDARMFAAPLEPVSRIHADHRIVTMERPAAVAPLTYEELNRFEQAASEALAGPVVWAPTTRISRDALSFAAPHWALTGEDWNPAVPAGDPIARDALERARPTIGMARIARTRSGPWSVSMKEPAPAFAAPNVMWRLRAAPDAPRPAWPRPAPMEFWPDDRISLPAFLAKIDILANPDSAAEDPCPIEALYALRAGVVPFLDPQFRSVFAGTAVYCTPREMPQRAVELHDNRDLAADLRASAGDLLAEVFSASATVARVRELVGKPRGDCFAPAVHAAPATRALFYSTNGVGLGHLTRQLAIARRLPGRITPVFFSHSQAVDIVRAYGFAAEHLPYHAAYGERREHWNAALTQALATAIEFYRPSAVVFDGNVPFMGLMTALQQFPNVARVWIRRALWGPNRDVEALERGETFDLVLEPGEHAWARDDGPTVTARARTLTVPPIRLLDGNELDDRDAACAHLGLDPGHVNVLVALGSGNNIDTSRMTARALAHLHGRHGIGVAVAEWKIARSAAALPCGVARLTDYPFSRFLRAFDFAIAAAGYNTFAEHLAEGLPTIWVPNEHAEQDRQIHRARYAEARGVGCLVRHAAEFALTGAIDRFLDPANRDELRAAHRGIAEHLGGNGGGPAAEAVAGLCGSIVVRR